ncbi:MAG: iron export ABC transporter permease subunit FetB [Cyanobacteria bacterium P01_F01_bin.86]
MIELGLLQLCLALGLMLGAIALAYWQRLGLEWMLLIATARTVLQLFAVGFVLAVVFELQTPWSVLAVLLVMLSVATVVARNRIGKQLKHLVPIVAGTLLTSTALTMIYTNSVVIRPDVWYEPRYVIPLAGIVLGNAMNAASIAGDRLVSSLKRHQIEIETHLSLGATPDQAIAEYRKEAIKAGLIPTVNAMMVVGIVTLPGIITGQLLGGADPLNAALYQMVVMFMLAFSNLLTSVLITTGLRRRFFNAAMQFVAP